MEYHTGKVHSKFQAPYMFAVHMNVPFVKFQYRNYKVLHILYLQANPHFQKITTQAMNNIFSPGFLHLLHLNKLFRYNSTYFLTPRLNRTNQMLKWSIYGSDRLGHRRRDLGQHFQPFLFKIYT